MRTNLAVPFADKDRVKSLGARWDPARRTWYVPDGVDLASFLPWVPGLPKKLPKGVRKALRSGRGRP